MRCDVKLLASACAIALLTGCGIQDGDYVVYRVGLSSTKQSTSCYFPETEAPINTVEDSNSYGTPQTWVIYFASDDMVLDAAGVALRGDDSDDGYLFTSNIIDVTYVGIDQQEAKITENTVLEIDMLTDGDAVSGEFRETVNYDCHFLTATPSAGVCESIPDCKRTRTFSGVELDDVELTEGVDRPNVINGPVPPPMP
jgi:hypothetical protein